MKELRKIVKETLIAQKGKLYNFNVNNIANKGFDYLDIQNTINYFRFSPQQKKFREKIGMN